MLTRRHVCTMLMRTSLCTHNIRHTCIKVVRQTKLLVRPILNINSFLVSRMLQSEQSDILHKTYHLYIF